MSGVRNMPYAPIVAMGGAQAAIQLLPHLALKGRALILAPTYNEYAAVLSAAGWDVADAVVLLASESAAYISGTNLSVNGGLHMYA